MCLVGDVYDCDVCMGVYVLCGTRDVWVLSM